MSKKQAKGVAADLKKGEAALSNALKGYGNWKQGMKKCKNWAMDKYPPHWRSAKACIAIANPKVIIDIAKCAKNLNPAKIV